MHHNIDEIQKNPLSQLHPRHVPDALADGFSVCFDLVGYRPHLAVGSAGADHEVIRDWADLPQVKHNNVFAVRFLSDAGSGYGQFTSCICCFPSLLGHLSIPNRGPADG